MIISIHVPKTAGTTFAQYLYKAFPRGVLLDYGPSTMEVSDLIDSCFETVPGSNREENPEVRLESNGLLKCRSLLSESGIQVIHGHIDINKYLPIFPDATYVVWLREPLQRALSHYHFHKRALAGVHDKTNRRVYEGELNFEQWMALEENINFQYRLTNGDLSKFQFIGVAEEFQRCCSIFKESYAINHTGFDVDIPPENVNPEKVINERYGVDDRMRSRFTELNHLDMSLYRNATKRLPMIETK